MEYVTLNNGVKMPMIGFGVFRLSPKSLLNSISILRAYCMNTQKRRDPSDPCDP